MNRKILIIFLMILGIAVLSIAGFFAWQKYFPSKPESETAITGVRKLKLDSQKEATHLSKVAGEAGAYWMRGYPIVWNEIEKKKGKCDWTSADEGLRGKDDYFSKDALHIAMIWPYANWDQKACHEGEKYKATGHLKESDEDLMMGKPCDMQAYASFVEKVVERYDGDGNDDMPALRQSGPGLKTPVKYWEIMNEPEMQGGSVGGAGEDLKFFVGSSQDYLAILKTSYEAIKRADPEAKVAHAGMAGIQDNFKGFWNPVFAAGAGNYFDIANIHTISTDEQREDLFVIKFKKYLEKYGIKDKPIWITEVQFGRLQEKPKDLAAFEKLMARASVFSLAKGADKLFYIENWMFWDDRNAFKKPEEDGPKDKDNKKKKELKPKPNLSHNTTHKVYLNLIKNLNSFDKIEVLREQYIENADGNSGATSQVGQYKFISGNKTVYVLWGSAPLPAEISGRVRATDIYGESKETDTGAIQLSDSPIFIEKIET